MLTLHLVPFRLGVMLLGLLEVGLAIGLYLIPRYTWVLWLTLAHLVGTFAPFLLFPEMTLGRVPGSLSLAGQYIVKNLVLLGAVWFLIQHHRNPGAQAATPLTPDPSPRTTACLASGGTFPSSRSPP